MAKVLTSRRPIAIISMKKEYVVVRIDASPDGSPYVFITLSDAREVRGEARPFGSFNVMSFSSMEELMKNLNRALSSLPQQLLGGMTTTIKMDLKEYEDSGIKVGDRVLVEITKVEREGV